MKCWLNGEKIVPMDPWYRGFKGTIEKTDKEGEYLVTGKVEEIDDQTFRITELPIGMWNEYYIQFLESITEGAPNVKDPLIESFRQNGGNATVDIEIRMKPDKIALIMQEGLLKKFKLTTTISTSNMHLFDAEGKFKKFDSPEQILEEFFALRLSYYEKRKENILANLRHRIVILENKCRFLSAVFKGDIILKTPCQEGEVVSELKQKGFTPIPRKGKSAESQVVGANDDNSEAQEDDNNKEEGAWGGYEYLMFNPLIFFTLENLDNLLAEKTEKEKELENLKAASTTSLWMADLVELEKKLDEIDRKEAEEEKKRSSQAGKAAKTQNVEPATDNTSLEVENVVDVTKPKGREGSKKTQKDSAADDITSLSSTSLEECLDAYNFKSSSSSEITGVATESEEPPLPSAAKKRKVGFGIDLLSSSRMETMRESRFNKKCDFILGMETEDMSSESETEAMMSSDSESSESESDHDDSGCSKLDSDSNDLDDSDSD